MSHSTTPAHAAGQQKVFSINWSLLFRRLRLRGGQVLNSARHRANHTEYIPPVWMSQLRLTWFRLGLIALAVFVFTQKQIDFTFTVGANGVGSQVQESAGQTTSTASQTTALSMLPTGTATPAPAPVWSVDQFDAPVVREYIDRFERVARTEEEKYGIPAAAKLAMAILESDAGQATAAIRDNNHFAASIAREYYDNAWTSWRAHSQSVTKRFPELAHESVNYQQWIAALAKTNYSSDPHYTQKLLQIIEAYDLKHL
ncbi:glucosaminidase domain-containing protein [Neolewinella sp.]|uniref:glucosaminidase domain-containing protein n=1 Tax=Neolewinella sp. TaxID=2993543 RepID=UPI003B52E3DC